MKITCGKWWQLPESQAPTFHSLKESQPTFSGLYDTKSKFHSSNNRYRHIYQTLEKGWLSARVPIMGRVRAVRGSSTLTTSPNTRITTPTAQALHLTAKWSMITCSYYQPPSRTIKIKCMRRNRQVTSLIRRQWELRSTILRWKTFKSSLCAVVILATRPLPPTTVTRQLSTSINNSSKFSSSSNSIWPNNKFIRSKDLRKAVRWCSTPVVLQPLQLTISQLAPFTSRRITGWWIAVKWARVAKVHRTRTRTAITIRTKKIWREARQRTIS